MTKLESGIETFKKMKEEAEKYENCLSEWAAACGVKYPTFNAYFRTRYMTPKILNAMEVGIPIIIKYQNREQELVHKAQAIFNR